MSNEKQQIDETFKAVNVLFNACPIKDIDDGEIASLVMLGTDINPISKACIPRLGEAIKQYPTRVGDVLYDMLNDSIRNPVDRFERYMKLRKHLNFHAEHYRDEWDAINHFMKEYMQPVSFRHFYLKHVSSNEVDLYGYITAALVIWSGTRTSDLISKSYGIDDLYAKSLIDAIAEEEDPLSPTDGSIGGLVEFWENNVFQNTKLNFTADEMGSAASYLKHVIPSTRSLINPKRGYLDRAITICNKILSICSHKDDLSIFDANRFMESIRTISELHELYNQLKERLINRDSLTIPDIYEMTDSLEGIEEFLNDIAILSNELMQKLNKYDL